MNRNLTTLPQTLYVVQNESTSLAYKQTRKVFRHLFRKQSELRDVFMSHLNDLWLSIFCKTQCSSRQHNNNINHNNISINTQLICYMFRLFWAIIRHTLQELVFISFVLQFLSYCIGDPFCITNHNYYLYGVRCPLLFVIGGGGFSLVNIPVVLVYGYGRGSCHLDFCVDVCLPDRRWVRASVPLWCIFLLAGVVGFTRLILWPLVTFFV